MTKRCVWAGIFLSFSLLIPNFGRGEGQSNQAFQDRLSAGIRLHDMGSYDGALNIFTSLLRDYPKEPELLYEMAHTSYAAKKYDDAIKYAEASMASNPKYKNLSYVIIGNSYDDQGNLKKADTIFRKAAREFPNDHLIHFNYAVNLVKQNNLSTATKHFETAIVLKPQHASSWIALATLFTQQGRTARSLVTFARFLTIESDSVRSRDVARLLWPTLFKGVNLGTDAEGNQRVVVNANELMSEKDPTMGEQVWLSLVAATRYGEDWGNKSNAQYFAYALAAVPEIIETRNEDKKEVDYFWKPMIYDYFGEAGTKGYSEAMAYDIRRTLGDPETDAWLRANADLVARFRAWSANWKPKGK